MVVCDRHLLDWHLLVLLRLTHWLSILNGLLDRHRHVGGIRGHLVSLVGLLARIVRDSLSSVVSWVLQGLLLLPAVVEDLEAGKGAWDEDQGGDD